MKNTYNKKRIYEMCLFSMLGAIMFCSKIIMEFLPNIHLLGALTIAYTLVFRVRALIPIYLYVLLNGIYAGFSVWWLPYTYIWTILWAITMLLPRNMPQKACAVISPLLCALHGLSFGMLYAPAQALFFGFSFDRTISWIIAGLPWDFVHMAGNFAVGLLILPMKKVLTRLNRYDN